MNFTSLRWIVAAAAFAMTPLFADVKLPAIISDNMALQQGKPVPVWGWAEPKEAVTVKFGDQTKTTTAGDDGKWMVMLDALKAGDKGELVVSGKNTLTVKNVLVGEVWVCSGQSNMEFVVNGSINSAEEKKNANYPEIRHFLLQKKIAVSKPEEDCKGAWTVCTPETVGGYTAVGYYFGRELHTQLKTPVGLIHTSWGGTPAEAWVSREVLSTPELKYTIDNFDKYVAGLPAAMKKWEEDTAKYKANPPKAGADGKVPQAPKKPNGPESNPNGPAVLYNGMIAPILPYGIAGATWYQGESNAGRAMEYRKLLPAMITDWRTRFKQGDFPFLIVQLANFMKLQDQPSESGENGWAVLRESQNETALKVGNSAVAVAIDIGDAADIHPKNKQDVGKRLAYQALRMTYKKDIPNSGPTYDSMKVEGKTIRLTFKDLFGGLEAKGGELKGFAIAGADKKFEWAEAKIDGETIVVSSEKVAAPTIVRYAWGNNPTATLYNKAGIPASPFRTDNPH